MAGKLGRYFNHRGRRYSRVFFGGLSRDLAKEKLALRRKNTPSIFWAIRKEADGTYSLGRAHPDDD